ncbi:MAG: DUF4198 domain-containing protein [Planctomycetota bacterium]|nr:MAG: DUF4198 domain-containing protein [Planctomycetota bacterium]
MRRTVRLATALVVVLFVAVSAARAHFTIVLPDASSVRKGDTVRLDMQFGHPFEHELADMPPPARLALRSPTGTIRELTNAVSLYRTLPLGSGKARTYRARWQPDVRGDWLVDLRTAPMRHGAGLQRDHVKLVVHVQAERGWDAVLGQPLEIVPLTRPYGLFPGVTLRGQVFANGSPLAQGFAYVSVERYNPRAPKTLPPEERITRTERTGPGGTFAVTLPEAGWWVIAAERPRRTESAKVHERGLLWVYVPPVSADAKTGR